MNVPNCLYLGKHCWMLGQAPKHGRNVVLGVSDSSVTRNTNGSVF